MKVLRRVLVSHFYGVLLGGLSGLSKTKIFDVLVITSLMVNYFSTGFNEETVYYSLGGGARCLLRRRRQGAIQLDVRKPHSPMYRKLGQLPVRRYSTPSSDMSLLVHAQRIPNSGVLVPAMFVCLARSVATCHKSARPEPLIHESRTRAQPFF